MQDFNAFLASGCDAAKAPEYGVYPKSIDRADGATVFMADAGDRDLLVAAGKNPGFAGESRLCGETPVVVAELTHENAQVLRRVFPYTAPTAVLTSVRSCGVGDRLGIATDGHIRVFERFDARPVFAQQSIRELNLTGRTYDDVLDCATFSVYRCGFKKGFGADGDHLKTPQEVDYAISSGYTMITLDCSEHIDNTVEGMDDAQLAAAYRPDAQLEALYAGKSFEVEGETLTFDDRSFKQAVLIYGRALDFATEIYKTKIQPAPHAVDFEISIDETATPTDPIHHYFVAAELARRGVKTATVAPRFCGEFQKGVDYRGDLAQFERELKVHAAIARKFGYKLSIHSGSDKFAVFALIGKYTKGNFHVKTAGTNWLEAMRLVAMKDPALYREVHAFALEAFEDAKRFYHVSTDLAKIPALDTLSDAELPGLFAQDDPRQLIHITYGHILQAKNPDGSSRFRDRLFALWRREREGYAELLDRHIGRHLETLYSLI